MSRILQAMQRRQGNGRHKEEVVPEGIDPTEFFGKQGALLGSTKFSKGEVTPLFGTRGVSETDRAVVACNDYLRMGAGRSIAELHREYVEAKNRGESVPTTGSHTLYEWSSRYNWSNRSSEYDADLEGIKNSTAQEVLSTGLSLSHERIVKLKVLAEKLEEEIHEEENLWLEDWKILGRGREAKIVKVFRFNSQLVDQYRRTMEDIAKETGGRVSKQELTGADGSALGVGVFSVDDIRNRISKRIEDLVASGTNGDDVSRTT